MNLRAGQFLDANFMLNRKCYTYGIECRSSIWSIIVLLSLQIGARNILLESLA